MDKLKMIAEHFAIRGITSYYVGGTVRNEIMGLPIDDIDICLVGVKDKAIVPHIVGRFGSITEEVGNVFPNWTAVIDGQKVDFALARTEKKTGETHQEFACEVSDVSIFEDLGRRDLTINAIAKNVLTGDIVDPYNGVLHIEQKYLHSVSDAFMEDDLRVIRAARFLSYFPDFFPSSMLSWYAQHMYLKSISKERIGMEMMKVMKYAKKPSVFFNYLSAVGWLEGIFPELHACINVPQNPKHHPEGDVFTHIMHCVDAVPEGNWFMRTVMLCHDLGKAVTTEVTMIPDEDAPNSNDIGVFYKEKVTAHGHEEAGVPLAKAMLERIVFSNSKVRDQIGVLVENHMLRAVIDDKNYDKLNRRVIRKLMKHDLKHYDLVRTIYYDLSGRPPKPRPEWHNLINELHAGTAKELEDTGAMNPIVTGKELIALGMQPSPEMGKIIDHALVLQDRGTLNKDNWQKVLKGAGYKFFKTLNS